MPFIHEHKILFVHIPKTGGTSILHYFGIPECENNLYGFAKGGKSNKLIGREYCTMQHMKAYEIRKFNPVRFKEYKKFTIIRNPYSRIFSVYNQQVNLNNEHLFFKHKMSFTDFLFNLKEQYNILYDPKKVHQNGSCHFINQWEYIYDEFEDKKLINNILRYENLEMDFKKLCLKFRINHTILPHSNKGEYMGNYMSAYTNELKDIVYKLYEKDFKLFEYGK